MTVEQLILELMALAKEHGNDAEILVYDSYDDRESEPRVSVAHYANGTKIQIVI